MYKKLLISLVILAGVCIAFAGCGGGAEESGQEGMDAKIADTMSFKTVDVEGNEVESDELFAGSKVTMVNVWGTFCGPCINEMPELEKLSEEYKDKGASIVGIVGDVPVDKDDFLQDAKDIIGQTGVTYTNVRAWDGFDEDVFITAVPTTFFVDSQGKVIGEPVVGAYIEGYREMLDRCLAEVGN